MDDREDVVVAELREGAERDRLNARALLARADERDRAAETLIISRLRDRARAILHPASTGEAA